MIPRQDRIRNLAERIYERERLSGSGAIESAIARTLEQFGTKRIINDRKLAVENAMCRGAGSVHTRCSYGNLAFTAPKNVDGAVQTIERQYRSEIRHRQMRQRSGCPLAHPSVEHRLIEARIFLRWYRRFGDRAAFAGIVEALTTSPVYLVAAE